MVASPFFNYIYEGEFLSHFVDEMKSTRVEHRNHHHEEFSHHKEMDDKKINLLFFFDDPMSSNIAYVVAMPKRTLMIDSDDFQYVTKI